MMGVRDWWGVSALSDAMPVAVTSSVEIQAFCSGYPRVVTEG